MSCSSSKTCVCFLQRCRVKMAGALLTQLRSLSALLEDQRLRGTARIHTLRNIRTHCGTRNVHSRTDCGLRPSDTKKIDNVENHPNYEGRVESSCGENSCNKKICNGKCTLRIRDLRPSDSNVDLLCKLLVICIMFRIITSHPDGNCNMLTQWCRCEAICDR